MECRKVILECAPVICNLHPWLKPRRSATPGGRHVPEVRSARGAGRSVSRQDAAGERVRRGRIRQVLRDQPAGRRREREDLVRARAELHHRLHRGQARRSVRAQGTGRRVRRAAARRADHRGGHGRGRDGLDRWLHGDIRAAGRQQRDLAEGRPPGADVHGPLRRPRGKVFQRRGLREAASEHPAVPGLAGAERRLTGSAPTASTIRPRKAASAASSAAPPSW